MLQAIHGLWVEEVVLAFAAPLVFTTQLQLAVCTLLWSRRMCHCMANRDLLGDLIEADATKTRDRSGEVFVDQILCETDGFEDLCSGVRSDGRHAHLRHHLQHTFATCLDVVLDCLVWVHATERVKTFTAVSGDHVLDRLEGEILVDCTCTESDQQGHVVHFASVSTLDDEADLCARLFTNEVVVHCAGQQQRRDRRIHLVTVAIRQDQNSRTGRDRGRRFLSDTVESDAKALTPVSDSIEAADHRAFEVRHVAVVVDVDDLGEVVVVDDRKRQRQLTTAVGTRRQKICLRTDTGPH